MAHYDLTIQTGSDYTKIFTIKQNNIPMDLTSYNAYLYIIRSPGELSLTTFSTLPSGHITNGGINGTLTLQLSPEDIETIDGNFYKIELDDGTVETEIITGNIFLLSETKTGVEYLIPNLRLQLGDINSLQYRYLDEWLKVSLITAIKALQRWWGDRYLINEITDTVYRGTSYTFAFAEPPIIQGMDERPIILMATILIESGQLESNSWSVGSWKDAEIAVSNIEGNKAKQFGLGLVWEELKLYIIPPTKRLAQAIRVPHPITEE